MLFVLVPFELSTSLLELDGALRFGIPFFFRLVGGLFSVFPVGVEAGRRQGRKEAGKEGRNDGCFQFLFSGFPFLVAVSYPDLGFQFLIPLFSNLLVPLPPCIWFTAFAPSCDYYSLRFSLWLSRP